MVTVVDMVAMLTIVIMVTCNHGSHGNYNNHGNHSNHGSHGNGGNNWLGTDSILWKETCNVELCCNTLKHIRLEQLYLFRDDVTLSFKCRNLKM